jgi:hypothetical protein
VEKLESFSSSEIVSLANDYWSSQVEIAGRYRARTTVSVTLATAIVGAIALRLGSASLVQTPPVKANAFLIVALVLIGYCTCLLLLLHRPVLRRTVWILLIVIGAIVSFLLGANAAGFVLGISAAALHLTTLSLIHSLHPTPAAVVGPTLVGHSGPLTTPGGSEEPRRFRPFQRLREFLVRIGVDGPGNGDGLEPEQLLQDPASRNLDVDDAVVNDLQKKIGQQDFNERLKLLRLRKLLEAARSQDEQNVYRRIQLVLAERALQKALALLAIAVLLTYISTLKY